MIGYSILGLAVETFSTGGHILEGSVPFQFSDRGRQRAWLQSVHLDMPDVFE